MTKQATTRNRVKASFMGELYHIAGPDKAGQGSDVEIRVNRGRGVHISGTTTQELAQRLGAFMFDIVCVSRRGKWVLNENLIMEIRDYVLTDFVPVRDDGATLAIVRDGWGEELGQRLLDLGAVLAETLEVIQEMDATNISAKHGE